jgi:hypothetical protein
MRVYLLGLIGALGLVAGLQTATATPSLSSSTGLSGPPISVPAASHKCAQGQRWVPAGYAKHGKYRSGHCAAA